MTPRIYRVGTFWLSELRAGKRALAYLREYNPAWPGCIEYDVTAATGLEAKKKAKQLRLEHETAREAAE